MKFSLPDLQALIKGAIPLRSRRDPAGAQSKRVSVDDLVKHRADAGDLCTFDSREGSFEIVVDGVTFLASQLWVFPKYDLQLAGRVLPASTPCGSGGPECSGVRLRCLSARQRKKQRIS